MKGLLLRGARVLDPAGNVDQVLDVRVESGKVTEVGAGLAPGAARVVEAEGSWMMPAACDMHVHLRAPGRSDEETVESGLLGAARGGFSDVACMPNTDPALDHPMLITALLAQAREAGHARLHPIAAATLGRRGEVPSDIPALVAAGAVAVSDDGAPVRHSGVARRVMEWLAREDRPLLEHAEDPQLSGNGAMHEGRVSLELGRTGWPAEAEELCVLRDLVLSRMTGAHVHICHVSAAGSVEAIRRARREGLRVTGETAPHYLWFTDEDTRGADGTFRVNPPLRSLEHRRALEEGLLDGTLTALATDHAPHSPEEKARPFSEAPPGFLGLETALGASHEALVTRLGMAPLAWASLWTRGPREILRLPVHPIAPGAPADLVLFDPALRWRVRAAEFASPSRNTPWEELELLGRPWMTLLAGRITHAAGAAQEVLAR